MDDNCNFCSLITLSHDIFWKICSAFLAWDIYMLQASKTKNLLQNVYSNLNGSCLPTTIWVAEPFENSDQTCLVIKKNVGISLVWVFFFISFPYSKSISESFRKLRTTENKGLEWKSLYKINYSDHCYHDCDLQHISLLAKERNKTGYEIREQYYFSVCFPEYQISKNSLTVTSFLLCHNHITGDFMSQCERH